MLHNEMIYQIISIVLAYLLGAIPTSVWIGKMFYNVDIRNQGSGNAGATNTFRILGYKAGIPVLIFDVFKGWAAVNLTYLYSIYPTDSQDFINLRLYMGFAAVFGHIFPVYVGFRGGKGVATLIGIGLALLPYPTLCSIAFFIPVFLIFRYVSLGSILSGISFVFFTAFVFPEKELQYLIFAITISVLLIITHHENIQRLLKGEEKKMSFFKRKK
ncbi:MAG: glycerol-3-phosphate 1-O-acyltransferase PlsY [Marinilabiliales bacterium]